MDDIIKRPRGRPRKVIEPVAILEDEEEITCPKCGTDDPGDWSQCEKCCPMPESPWYNKSWMQAKAPINLTPFGPDLPPDPWGKWKRFNVSETSKIFLEWMNEVRPMVLHGWELRVGNTKKFIRLYIKNGNQSRVFAFVKKSTGDIHTPATLKYPFTHFSGNICDPETRLSILTPYGVKAHWTFNPTHENYKESLAFLSMEEHNDELHEDDDE